MTHKEEDLAAVIEEGGQEPGPVVASGAEVNSPPTANKETRCSMRHCRERNPANDLSEWGRGLSPERRGGSPPGDTLIVDA